MDQEDVMKITRSGITYNGIFYPNTNVFLLLENMIAEVPPPRVDMSQPKVDTNKGICLDIYTDGSHKRMVQYLGIGAYCCYNDVEYKLSARVDQALLATYEITETTCSNPSAEYVALAEVLKKFKGCKIPKDTTLRFFSDYEGVQKWTNGEWKAKKPYIIKIRDFVQAAMKEIGCNFALIHVHGHTGIVGNEKADKLAGLASSFSNFEKLVELFK
jgi:ribonuclease HI